MVDIKAVEEIGHSVGAFARDMAKESSKLVAGWQRVDKLIMEQVIQSFYHMSWNLKDLERNIEEITGVAVEEVKSTYEDIRYPDHETLNAVILRERSKTWFYTVRMMHRKLAELLHILNSLEAKTYRVGFINSRIFLDLDFFKRQFEKATGEKLED